MHQIDLICDLVRQYGVGDKKKIYRLYGEAERAGKVTRVSNQYNEPPETYCLRYLSYLKSHQHPKYIAALRDYEARHGVDLTFDHARDFRIKQRGEHLLSALKEIMMGPLTPELIIRAQDLIDDCETGIVQPKWDSRAPAKEVA